MKAGKEWMWPISFRAACIKFGDLHHAFGDCAAYQGFDIACHIGLLSLPDDSFYVYSDNMTINDNSVNIENGKERYHHGDLRRAVLDEGLRLLGAVSADELSLREIARNVGVSATAVYRHFPDKGALLGALAHEAGVMLARAQRAAQAKVTDPKAGFEATGAAYVRFALAHPALFRLMMARMHFGGSQGRAGEDDGLTLLFDNVAALSPPDATEQEMRAKAIQSWAVVHGLAMLMLDGQVPVDDQLIEQVTRWN